MDQKIFAGLKVVELASVLAGPAVGMFFAELGAEVIKIENKTTGGDITRQWRLSEEDKTRDYSAYYCSVNWGKTSLMLDLSVEDDRLRAHQLVGEADIVISNFKPESARRLKMSYEDLSRLHPQLIYGQLYAFGKDIDRLAFDVVLQAEAGFLYMNGEPGREPVRMPVALIDLLAAHQLKEGLLVALLKKYRTGKGSLVETSLFESAVASLANQATNWLMEGHLPGPMGMRHPNIAPYGDIFLSQDDKHLVTAVGTDHQFRQLCRGLNMQELLDDQRFKTNKMRVTNRQALADRLRPAFRLMSRAEIMAMAREQNIPIGAINNLKEVFEQELAKAMILEDRVGVNQSARRVKTVAFRLQDPDQH